PKSHFRQCRSCYKLNHIACECPKKRKACKFCGLANHEAAKCRDKNNPSKHKCVLCNGQHPSNSVHCEVIRKAREKLDAFLKKKASQTIPIKSNVHQQANNYSYTDAAKGQRSNGNENDNGPQKPKKRTNRKKNKRQINNDQKQKNKKSDADEILSLRRELAEMKSAFQQLQSFLQSINPVLI
ncbi:hypothetical protein RFI_00130, partial [Reticulomyxa filosa]